MGVPRLFPWLRSHADRGAVHYFAKGEWCRPCDYLYLDANGLLHTAAQQVFGYGAYAPSNNDIEVLFPPNEVPPDAPPAPSYPEKVQVTYERFWSLVCTLVSIMPPRKVLFIALDGPAPVGKQMQQRKRRFVAARTREATGGAFDSNAITPGTAFSQGLTEWLHHQILVDTARRPRLRRVRIVCSPSSMPGEGEHKILEYIRALPASERAHAEHCLYGLDGDLLMLTLGLVARGCSTVWLLREDQYSRDKERYYALKMGAVGSGAQRGEGERETGEGVYHTVGRLLVSHTGREARSTESVRGAVLDFIALGFLVGNDFVHRIRMFHILDDGLDAMVKVHRRHSHRLTEEGPDGFRLSHMGFTAFLKDVAAFERAFLEGQAQPGSSRRRGVDDDPRFRNATLLAHVVDTPSGPTLDYAGYRTAYYTKAFEGKPWTERDVAHMCRAYYRTLHWIFLYYVMGLPSWTWAYPHHYCPLMEDVHVVVAGMTAQEAEAATSFSLDRPSPSLLQLLSVLPPASAALLPERLRGVLCDEASPLVSRGYCPAAFPVDYEGVSREFEGIPLIPHPSRDIVSHAAQSYASVRFLEDVGYATEVCYDPRACTSWRSGRGVLRHLPVRVRVIASHPEKKKGV